MRTFTQPLTTLPLDLPFGQILGVEFEAGRYSYRLGLYVCNLFKLTRDFGRRWYFARRRDDVTHTLRLLWFAVGRQKLRDYWPPLGDPAIETEGLL